VAHLRHQRLGLGWKVGTARPLAGINDRVRCWSEDRGPAQDPSRSIASNMTLPIMTAEVGQSSVRDRLVAMRAPVLLFTVTLKPQRGSELACWPVLPSDLVLVVKAKSQLKRKVGMPKEDKRSKKSRAAQTLRMLILWGLQMAMTTEADKII
jgi:hypothetical protein